MADTESGSSIITTFPTAFQGAEAYENSKFQAVIAGKAKEARLVFTDGGLTWTYNQNWSIARLEKDQF